MEFDWVDGFELSVRIDGDAAIISGNAAGLRSLAKHLDALANQDGCSHFHLDKHNSLEDGSADLIIEKTE
ncbi:MAG: hypothetical protein IJH83_01075 [Coriobacteriales bacterium]|nr:hypothetical protein [Coriobacteriales bacterium]